MGSFDAADAVADGVRGWVTIDDLLYCASDIRRVFNDDRDRDYDFGDFCRLIRRWSGSTITRLRERHHPEPEAVIFSGDHRRWAADYVVDATLPNFGAAGWRWRDW